MGIPKFYRWLSERYPLLNQRLTETEAPPEFDNLYLDMNGIIHNCTHANDSKLILTEEEMMLRIFNYIDKLVHIVKPQKVLFMAIDGVAPRAKMNQQRSRRFRSAEERAKVYEEMKHKGEEVPDDPFDSNCITPGTEFMGRLGKHLRFFIRKKISEDPVWQAPAVVFSGHDVPGEGEHKIMEYIRLEKKQQSYLPNQRHVMYGLDADLVMLSLVTHEPHFCLLREVVSYTGGARGQPARETLENPCAENFILFQIGLLREYLELEFQGVELPFPLDVERVVDDFVFFCMLVGNDFLPALPTLDISEGALNNMLKIYKEILPSNGYLTDSGIMVRDRVQLLLQRLGEMELEILEERAQDAEYFENKRSKRREGLGNGNGNGNGYGNGRPTFTNNSVPRNGAAAVINALEVDLDLELEASPLNDMDILGVALEDALVGPLELEEEVVAAVVAPTMMSKEARSMFLSGNGEEGLQLWKDRYYREKLEILPSDARARRAIVEVYFAGLAWVLEYYYRGVASWNWYYPHHYAPLASDVTDLVNINVNFDMGAPFKPFEQLMAVLPPASSKLVPPAYRSLMLNPDSPIIDFYPSSFEVDMEGKRADWEGVAKICFVDERTLLAAMRSSVPPSSLTGEERERNSVGSILIFRYEKGCAETTHCDSTLPRHFPNISHPHSTCAERPPMKALPSGEKGFTAQLTPGTQKGSRSPLGFPTLKSMPVTTSLRNVGVTVLGIASKKESLLLGLRDLRTALPGVKMTATDMAPDLLNAHVYINWPYLQEAKVIQVCDSKTIATVGGTRELSPEKAGRWSADIAQLTNLYLTKRGLDVGHVDILVKVLPCLGFVKHLDGTVEKRYASTETSVPVQVIARKRPQTAEASVTGPREAALTAGMQVLFLGAKHYGCTATILQQPGVGLSKLGKPIANKPSHFCISVMPEVTRSEDLARMAKRIIRDHAPRYLPSGAASRQVGVQPRLLGRITSNVWVTVGEKRYDVGLAVKQGGKNLCVPGYTCVGAEGNGWSYSPAMLAIVREHRNKFGWIWKYLEQQSEYGEISMAAVLPGTTTEEQMAAVVEVQRWLKTLPIAKRPLVKSTVELVSEDGMRALQAAITPMPHHGLRSIQYENVSPVLLLPPYVPGPNQVQFEAMGGSFELGDRVVNVCSTHAVPFGLHGTVTGVYDDACEVMFDKEFGTGTNLSGRVSTKCGAHVPNTFLLNVSSPVTIPVGNHPAPREVMSTSKNAISETAEVVITKLLTSGPVRSRDAAGSTSGASVSVSARAVTVDSTAENAIRKLLAPGLSRTRDAARSSGGGAATGSARTAAVDASRAAVKATAENRTVIVASKNGPVVTARNTESLTGSSKATAGAGEYPTMQSFWSEEVAGDASAPPPPPPSSKLLMLAKTAYKSKTRTSESEAILYTETTGQAERGPQPQSGATISQPGSGPQPQKGAPFSQPGPGSQPQGGAAILKMLQRGVIPRSEHAQHSAKTSAGATTAVDDSSDRKHAAAVKAVEAHRSAHDVLRQIQKLVPNSKLDPRSEAMTGSAPRQTGQVEPLIPMATTASYSGQTPMLEQRQGGPSPATSPSKPLEALFRKQSQRNEQSAVSVPVATVSSVHMGTLAMQPLEQHSAQVPLVSQPPSPLLALLHKKSGLEYQAGSGVTPAVSATQTQKPAELPVPLASSPLEQVPGPVPPSYATSQAFAVYQQSAHTQSMLGSVDVSSPARPNFMHTSVPFVTTVRDGLAPVTSTPPQSPLLKLLQQQPNQNVFQSGVAQPYSTSTLPTFEPPPQYAASTPPVPSSKLMTLLQQQYPAAGQQQHTAAQQQQQLVAQQTQQAGHTELSAQAVQPPPVPPSLLAMLQRQ